MRLESFEIDGFRAFDHISFSRLADVNLLVGKNSIGKTTALEAIRLYLTSDYYRIAELLASRDEFSFRRRRRRIEGSADPPLLAFESMFSGRPPLESHPLFEVGPIAGDKLSVGFSWVRRIEDEATAAIRYVPGEGDGESDPDLIPGLSISNHVRALIPFDRLERFARRTAVGARPADQAVVYLPSSGMSATDLGRSWDSVALTEDEDTVIDTLRSIVPTLDKLVLVQSPGRSSERILMAKLSEFSEPVPFKSLGDGALHMLGIVLAMLNAKDGVLLCDEIENGLHFSVQEPLWAIIRSQARAWNVQVFATTHSWDCVRGLQAAATHRRLRRRGAEVALYRIEKAQMEYRVTKFTSDELAIAQQDDIEIR